MEFKLKYWKKSQLSALFCSFLTLTTPSILADTLTISDDELFEPDIMVLSPTRLKQAIRNTPASITVIEQETLISLGITEIVEALQLVPGFSVGHASGNEYRVTYHGGSGLIPRRLQVLINGMPIYRGGYAKIDWESIPVAVEDVKRITVTRSPSSASYGANSFQAVVSIETKKPRITSGSDLIVSSGSNGEERYSAQHSDQAGDTFYRLRIEKNRNSGYDKNFVGDSRHDSFSKKKVALQTETTLRDDSSLSLFLAAVHSDLQNEFVEVNQVTFPDLKNSHYYFSGSWAKDLSPKNQLQVQLDYTSTDTEQSWYACHPTILFSDELRALQLANPAYATTIIGGGMPSGGTSEDDQLAMAVFAKLSTLGSQALADTCAEANQNVDSKSTRLDIQNTYIFNNDFRFVSGLGILYNEIESNSFLAGTVRDASYYAFTNSEYLYQDFVFNAGFMVEKKKNHSQGFEYSPRVSVNYHLDRNQTLRFVYSKSIRTTDALESDRDWSYPVTELSFPVNDRSNGYFYFNTVANADLRSEKIESKEISYFASFHDYKLTMDVKLFHETLWDLISEKLQFFDYNPTNDGWMKNKGVDIQINFSPLRQLNIGTTYSYLDSRSNNFFEKMMDYKHSGSIYSIYKLDSDYDIGLAYYGANNIGGSSFDKVEAIVSKTFILSPDIQLKIRGKVTHRKDSASFYTSKTFSVENNYDNQNSFVIDTSLRF
jgi:iron complex outermembrane receptor protein